jgi:thioredoxin-like negative regulator of GroEL
MDRLGMLRKMAAAKPDEPFPAYGLAMELSKQGHAEEARDTFAALIERSPDYVPSYLMYGNHLVSMGAKDDAAGVFTSGIDAAKRTGDDHARSELQAALDELSHGDDA